MTEPARDDHAWILAYLRGLREIHDTGPWPSVPLDAAFALINLAVKIRQVTAAERNLAEMAVRRLTFATDQLVAMLFAPGDADGDRDVVVAWRQARREAEQALADG